MTTLKSKTTNYILVVLLNIVMILALFPSCKKQNFLDSADIEVLNKENVFADSARTMNFLTGVYGGITFGYSLDRNASEDYSKMSDEAEGRYPSRGNYDKDFTQAAFNAPFYNNNATHWLTLFSHVRNANIFLAEVDKSPISSGLNRRTKAEARFLRAHYYFILLKLFGGIPLLGDQVFSTSDQPEISRAPFSECVDYIVSELDETAALLPAGYTGRDYGRITSGACLGLKSRVLLFAASPLYNGGSTATTPELIEVTAYPVYDASRWEKARQAALDVINLGLYSLTVDNATKPGNGFYRTFLTRENSEFILPAPQAPGKVLERAYFPRTRGGGSFYYYPTQEFVDMFPMLNGKAITDPTSGYNPQDPYKNRDPRFGYSVIYNQSLLYLQSARALAPVNIYVGAPGNDKMVAPTSNAQTTTGYYVRKMCDEMAVQTGGVDVNRSLPIIRYAEILLNYAEASNEVGNTTDVLDALKQIRLRAGIQPGADLMYGLPASPTKDELRAIIQNERAVELAFEHHRFYDLRRWKLAMSVIDGKSVHGMEITRIGTTGQNYTYKIVPVRSRFFKEIYYYMPIPNKDITISHLLQNPEY